MSIDQLIAYVKGLIDYIANWIQDAFDVMGGWFSDFIVYMKGFLSTFTTELTKVLQQVLTNIQTFITQFVDKLRTYFQDIADAIWALVTPIIANVKNLVTDAITFLQQEASAALGYIGSFATNVYNTTVQYVSDLVTPIVEWFNTTSRALSDFMTQSFSQIKDSYNALVAGIKASFDQLIGGTSATIATINQRIQAVGGEFQAAARTVADSIAAVGKGIADPIERAVTEALKPFAQLIDGAGYDDVKGNLMGLLSSHTLALSTRDDAQQMASRIYPNNPIYRWVFLSAISPALILGVYRGVIDANAQVILQEFAQNYHYQLLSPADLTLAVLRGDRNRQEAVTDIVKQGYSPKDADQLVSNSSAVPSVGDLLVMKNRELLPDDTITKAFIQLGYDQKTEKAYRDLANQLPGIQDLITMAVKGAFSPAEVEEFRTDEDFPSSIVPFAKQQGLSEDWMKKYWRSHWNLPSPTQGFDMFHRGIITKEQLTALLKAQDFVPGWRDKMIELSYDLLTRVDIRRLHQLGMLTTEQVKEEYKKSGYSPENAEKLALFTEQLNKGKPGEADEELGRLSRTNVVNFYQDGVITRERAIELLTDIGYTPDAATLFIDTADFDAERVKRASEIDFIIANASAGVIDYSKAQDELARLHLSPTELDRASTKLLREQTKATKLPTVDQGTKMFQAQVITEDQFRDLLRRLGYRAEWASAFVGLAKTKTKAGSEPV